MSSNRAEAEAITSAGIQEFITSLRTLSSAGWPESRLLLCMGTTPCYREIGLLTVVPQTPPGSGAFAFPGEFYYFALDKQQALAVICTHELLSMQSQMQEVREAPQWIAACAVPEGLKYYWHAYPPLKRWAFLCRAQGAMDRSRTILLGPTRIRKDRGQLLAARAWFRMRAMKC